jgi:NodT family efflux transporter outer membrane factor (OMF) lipoprotein
LERQLATNLTYLELVELRFRKSMVSALDVYQQKQIVERVKAEIPLVEAQEQLLLHELALLLGKPPRAAIQISSETLPSLSEIPATGLPADLLAARPDVRSAGLRLQEADWRVAVARADRLPAISLSANAGYEAAQLDLLFNNWILKLAGNFSAPVFDAGRRRAEVDRTRAVVDERLAKYRETVLTAIKEVEDALVSESKQREHIKALEMQTEAARKALEQAVLRYRKGIASYLPVLTQLLTVQGLERDLIQRQSELVIDRVSLYRALGGTWTQALRPDEGSNEAGTRGDVRNEG